ncbi:MAG TPA: hypothetical protein VEK08_00775 [Planctomycetota bacterium]|nr:hypothetical protein [Planctomycetota bacterium]
MANCPICKTPGAYVGFSTVECRNPDCEHFCINEEKVCPCCGKVGHTPDLAEDAADASQMIGSIQVNGSGGNSPLDQADQDDSSGPCTV